MAKKGDFDDIDLDDFNWDDFDDPPRQKDKTRNPIIETGNTIRKSALATIWPKHQRDQVILKGMPKPAADAYAGYANARDATKDVFAHTKEELVKTNRIVKQQARQLAPTLRKYLPEGLTKRIDKWSKSDMDQSMPYDPRQAQLDRELGSIFSGPGDSSPQDMRDARNAQRDAADQATTDMIRDSVRDMKADALLQTTIGMAKDVHLQTSLAKGVMLNVQRKQLELSYRQLFALEDLTKLTQAQYERNTPALEAIVKNTALPDYAKEDFSEIHWANIKRKAAEWMNPLRYAEGFVEQIRENTKKKISQGFGDLRGFLEMGLSSMHEDDFGMEDNSTITADKRKSNAAQKAAGLAGKQIGKRLLGPQVEKLQGKSREWLEANPEIMKQLQRGKYFAQNASSISNSGIDGEDMGVAGNLFRMLNAFGIIQPFRREAGMLDERNPEMLSRAAKFDHRTWLSINEIIPAWLGEINKSIRRGYGEHANLTYDITSRGFVDRKVVANRVRESVANDGERKRLSASIDKTVDFIDHNKSLNQKERAALAGYIEERASTGKAFDINALTRDASSMNRFMSQEAQSKVMGLLGSHPEQRQGGSYELSNALADRMRVIQSSISRRQGRIDAAVGVYGERALRDAGIFNYDAKKDTFGVDRDLSDPLTLFNSLEMGKTRSGRALTREQEIRRKLGNGSAAGDYLRRLGLDSDPTNDLLGGESASKGFGSGKFSLSGLSLSHVLYGDKPTTFPQLFEEYSKRKEGTTDTSDRIIEAIRSADPNQLLIKILDHVRDMNEDGIYLLGHRGGGYDEDEDAEGGGGGSGGPGPGGGGGRGRWRDRGRRAGDQARGLLSRWGGLIKDTTGRGYRFGKRQAQQGWRRGRASWNWLRSKMPTGGPSLFSRLQGTAANMFSGARTFGRNLMGAKDIYNAQGKVVLNGKRLAAGEYYQIGKGQSGKMTQLFKLDDIRQGRDIVDEQGNVILSATDLAQGGELTFYTGSRWKKLFDFTGGKVGELGNKLFSAPRALMDKLSHPIRTARAWLTQTPDAYVSGEQTPRLFANKLRQGLYLLKATGQPIYKIGDVTGAIVDAVGNEIITDTEIANPNFKLVDKWGRDIKSPLGRIVGRVGGTIRGAGRLLGRIPGMAREGWGKIMGHMRDNPLTRWWNNKEGGAFSNNTLFGGGLTGSTRKTNHILIRIYKLLNQRMPGEPEDESWTDSMEQGMRGAAGSVRNSLSRAWRRGRVLGQRRWGRRARNARNSISGWFGRQRDRASGFFDRFRSNANDFADNYRGARHDIGTRYGIEKHLAGRDDDVADFYRQKLYQRGGFSRAKITGGLNDAAEEVTDAAGNAINTGKKKVKTIGQAMLDKLSQMTNLQEISWFDRMRSSVQEGGGSEGFLRNLTSKFSRRNKFKEGSEKKDYFNFFRRPAGRHREGEGHTGGAAPGAPKGKGIMGMMTAMFGGVMSILGGIGSTLSGLAQAAGFVAKWGVWKPAKLATKAAWWVASRAVPTVARALVTPLITAGTALVTAIGWPAIAVIAGVAALGYGAYKLATTKYTQYLDKMRLAQYGMQGYDKWSGDDGAKVAYLEDNLKQYVSYNNAGEATLRGLAGKDVEALAEGFGIDKENKSELISFQAMMLQRFIPVYLRWMTSISQLSSDVQLKDLGDTSKVSKADMTTLFAKNKLTKDSRYLRAVEDPRKVDQGFFSKAWDAITFTEPTLLSADEVLAVQDEVEKSIKFRVDDKTAERLGKGVPVSQGVKVSGVADSVNHLAALDKERTDNTIKKEGWEDGNEQVTIQVEYGTSIDQKDVDALQSLRMKTYGLQTLNPTNVKLLMKLEQYVVPLIDSKTSSFKGNWANAIDLIVPGGSTSERADRLKYWFFNRFLPTLMTYMMLVKRYIPTADPLNLKMSGGYLYELGNLTSTSITIKNGIATSVWDVAVIPFDGEANTNPGSVQGELDTLKALSKEADLAVRNLMRENTKKTAKRAQWKTGNQNTGNFKGNAVEGDPNVKSYAPGSPEALAAGNISGGNPYANGGSGWNGSQEISAAGGVANYAALTTGNTAISLGAMGDGNYKALQEKYPLASLNNVDNVKAMIVEVANQLGVPPGVALGMANAESKFNYKAYNKASGAGGLFQFIKSTWSGTGTAAGEMQNYGNKFGIPAGSSQIDPYANALLGVNFIRNNIARAQKDYGGAVPPGVAYLYHFLGAGDGRKFMAAYKANPNAPANSVRYSSAGVIGNNESVFYDKSGRIRTLAGVMQELNGRMGSVVANAATSNPDLAKQVMGGQTPTASDPAMAAGAPAANDPNANAAGAMQNLPESNAGRRDDALAQKGAMAANDAANAAASVTGAAPGSNMAQSPSDISKAADAAAASAQSDGLSEADAAKVKAAYEKQAAARTRTPTKTSDASANDNTMTGGGSMADLIAIETASRDYLKRIADAIDRGALNGSAPQAPAATAPGSKSTATTVAPAPNTLNVSRKAS